MASLQPIQTEYNGYLFRSRLEARWAVFFDEMEIEYEYESEGFRLSNGNYYLPDFYLPQYKMYLEVKRKDAFKIEFVSEDMIRFSQDGDKYGCAFHDIVSSGMSFIIVFGDPLDAIYALWQEHHGHETPSNFKGSYLFTMGECVIHFMSNIDKDNEYRCTTGEDCRKCTHYNQPQCGQWFGMIDYADQKKNIVATFGDNLIPVCEAFSPVRVLSLGNNDVIDSFGLYFTKLKQAAKSARMRRFENN